MVKKNVQAQSMMIMKRLCPAIKKEKEKKSENQRMMILIVVDCKTMCKISFIANLNQQ